MFIQSRERRMGASKSSQGSVKRGYYCPDKPLAVKLLPRELEIKLHSIDDKLGKVSGESRFSAPLKHARRMHGDR